MPRLAALLMGLLLACGCSSAIARASEVAKLSVAFSPNRPGGNTTVDMGLAITTTTGDVPSPVTGFAMHIPSDLELIGSDLGLSICDPSVLLSQGPAGCSPNARLGSGTATVVLAIGPDPVEETTYIQALMGPPPDEQIGVLLYAEGRTPVFAQLIFPGVLFIGTDLSGETLATSIPPTPTLPDAPNASVTNLHLRIGPEHLTYYEKVHGKTVGYRPKGIAIPADCPHGGFPFVADMTFEDGTSLRARTVVPCSAPSRSARRKHSQ